MSERYIDEVKIGNDIFSIYLSIESAESLRTEMGICLNDLAEGTLARKIAQRIAKLHGVIFKNRGFGGHSAGDPPIYEKVFAVLLEKDLLLYISPKKQKKIREEINKARKKLIEAVEELNHRISKMVDLGMSPRFGRYRGNSAATGW